ncbi:VOC family protein [Cryobacterium melibiosiphilum]|uniref:VOC family protein n=1 Tax=Cryobacterium melibiosiphilum TaxID=995039 RepID=A0A3A5MDL8_9MICO|nr:VOC family protein [Cryobacterium melibiosiphilum]RJT88207.1 VOC family protein [Cryobacterium melibiosiphilum]
MPIAHLLAVVPVADFDAAHAWYEQLFGRPADNLPMKGLLVEWQVTDSGWVQVTHDAERAGTGLLNVAVDDLPQHLAELTARGLTPGGTVLANKGVQLSTLTDPDGNTITFIGGFRVEY